MYLGLGLLDWLSVTIISFISGAAAGFAIYHFIEWRKRSRTRKMFDVYDLE
jgi:hypothetical protein